jgi:iron(III) transport system permease protein
MASPATSPARLAQPSRARAVLDRLSPFAVVSLLLSIGFAVLAGYPIARVLVRLFVEDGSLNLDAIRRVFDQPDLWNVVGNTALLVGAGGGVALAGGSVLAWLNERTDARIGVIGNAVPLLPFLLPPIAGAIGWTILCSPGAGLLNVIIRNALGVVGIEMTEGPLDIYSWWGMIFLYALYMTPFTFLMVSAGLRNMDSQLEEQARMCGAGVLRTLRTVTIPAVRPNLGAALLLTVWFGFAFFSGPVILSSQSGIDVLAIRVVRVLSFSYPPDTGLAVGLSGFMLLAVVSAWYLQVRVLRRARHATVGGREKATPIELGRWKWLGRALLLGYVSAASVLPIAALLWVALRGYWSTDLDFTGLTIEPFREVFNDRVTRQALFTSLRLACIGATIGMLVASITAMFVKRSTSRLARLIDAMIKFPAPIPSIIIAVGFVLAFSGAPFNLGGTFIILLLAYIVLYMPQASVAADAAAAQVGVQLTEASFVSGARGMRTFLRVNLPLMLPGLVAGWALLFVWMLGEMNASAILAGTGNRVVGFQLLDAFIQGHFANLAALSIVLMLINSVAVLVVMLVGRRVRSGIGLAGSVV